MVLSIICAVAANCSPMPPPKLPPTERLTLATRPAPSIRNPLSTRLMLPSGDRAIDPLTTSSSWVALTVRRTSPVTTSVSRIRRSPYISRKKPLVTERVCCVTTRLPAASRWKPPNRGWPLMTVLLTANVSMVWTVEKLLISSRNWPLRLTPGIELEARVIWIRPTMPVVVPMYAARLITEVTEPRNGIVPPRAPSIRKYAVPVVSTARVMPRYPLREMIPPMVSWAWIVALT